MVRSERVVALAQALSEVLSSEGVSAAEVGLVAESVLSSCRVAHAAFVSGRGSEASWRSLCRAARVLESAAEFLVSSERPVSSEELELSELPMWALSSSSGKAREFSVSEAREEVSVALDLPRDWSEVPALADCVDALVDACFVESSSCPSLLVWRAEMLDPMQGAWSSAVMESGILSVLELVESAG